MKTFGERLRDARKAKNITQKQLADKIGAKHNSVSNWENDQNRPDTDIIELICGVLDIEPNYLLTMESITKRNIEGKSPELDQSYRILIHKYKSLDDKGKYTVDAVLEAEYKRFIKPHTLLNAAHEIKGATEEDKQHDEDIMNDDEFWK